MNVIELKAQKDRYLISLDKSSFDKKTIQSILERHRLELLAKCIDFDKSIEYPVEEVKQRYRKNKQ
ncbi:MAG: hypothetical protein HY960_06260 [Ignavibacteriae bacterium]|nr:hypothetical protein [Ignavibacteriota bacterium]